MNVPPIDPPKASPSQHTPPILLPASLHGRILHEDKPSVPALPVYVTFMATPAHIFHITVFSFMLYLYHQTRAVLYLVSATVFIHFPGISLWVLLDISCSGS